MVGIVEAPGQQEPTPEHHQHGEREDGQQGQGALENPVGLGPVPQLGGHADLVDSHGHEPAVRDGEINRKRTDNQPSPVLFERPDRKEDRNRQDLGGDGDQQPDPMGKRAGLHPPLDGLTVIWGHGPPGRV